MFPMCLSLFHALIFLLVEHSPIQSCRTFWSDACSRHKYLCVDSNSYNGIYKGNYRLPHENAQYYFTDKSSSTGRLVFSVFKHIFFFVAHHLFCLLYIFGRFLLTSLYILFQKVLNCTICATLTQY